MSGSALQRSNLAGSLGNLPWHTSQRAGKTTHSGWRLRASKSAVSSRPPTLRYSVGPWGPTLDTLAGAYAGTGPADAARSWRGGDLHPARTRLRRPHGAPGPAGYRIAPPRHAIPASGREDDAVTAITELSRSAVASSSTGPRRRSLTLRRAGRSRCAVHRAEQGRRGGRRRQGSSRNSQGHGRG